MLRKQKRKWVSVLSKCNKETEEICLCRDCAVSNCERFNCQECERTPHEKIHEVFCCNCFREIDCSKLSEFLVGKERYGEINGK